MSYHFPTGMIIQTNGSNTYRYGFSSGDDGYMYIDNLNLSTDEISRLQFSKNGTLDLLTINGGDIKYIGHFNSYFETTNSPNWNPANGYPLFIDEVYEHVGAWGSFSGILKQKTSSNFMILFGAREQSNSAFIALRTLSNEIIKFRKTSAGIYVSINFGEETLYTK